MAFCDGRLPRQGVNVILAGRNDTSTMIIPQCRGLELKLKLGFDMLCICHYRYQVITLCGPRSPQSAVKSTMIIPDSNDAATKLNSETSKRPLSEPSDPPPDYSQAASQNDLPSVQAPQLLPDVKPSNFVSLSRPNSSISGKWIIEPSLLIPPSLLPSLSSNETEETRRNLSLFSQNGNVDAEIFIMPSNNEASHRVAKRSRIYIEHDVTSTNPNKTRLPMTIYASSANGRINLYLPRSFQGPASFKTSNGSVRLSSAMKASETQFSDVDRTQRSFIGHFDPSAWAHEGWTGDELYVEAKNGNMNVYFDDEVDAPKVKSPKFFERIYQEFSAHF
ncbi:hypothetical protein BJ912DRAFT_1039347 [Pholiota molesta]|nr:hypothetical protein BJ912DRAFT_1039347 [Pholiota molesta]